MLGQTQGMSLATLRRNMTITMILLCGVLFTLISIISYYFGLDIYIAGPLVLFIVFAQWVLAPIIVSASTNLQYIKKGENKFLENLVRNIAQKSQIPVPRIAIVPDKTPNAFVFGRTVSSATLAVHTGLLKKLRSEEVEAVIAHEMGHIKHKDVMVMTVASAIPLVAYVVARSILWSRRSRRKNAGAIILVAVVSFAVYLISQMLVLYLSRSREHFADTYSAYITKNPRNLRSALAKITYGLSLSPKESTGLRAFYIGDPQKSSKEIKPIIKKKSEYDLDHDGVLNEKELESAMEKEAEKTPFGMANDLFSTHPSTYKRMLLLRKIEEELDKGQFVQDIYRFI